MVHAPWSHIQQLILRRVTLYSTCSGESLSMVHFRGSNSPRYILRGVSFDGSPRGVHLDGTASVSGSRRYSTPWSHIQQLILRRVALYSTCSGESLSTVHSPGSNSRQYILRELLSMVHLPGSHSRRYILRGVTLGGTSSGYPLLMVNPLGSHSPRYMLRGVTLYGPASWEPPLMVLPLGSQPVTLDGTPSGESLSTVQPLGNAVH